MVITASLNSTGLYFIPSGIGSGSDMGKEGLGLISFEKYGITMVWDLNVADIRGTPRGG